MAPSGQAPVQQNGSSTSSNLLLKLFESDQFNAHLAVSYLRTYSESIGITYYLVNKLAQFPEEEVEFYWPQLCHLLITQRSDSGALEGFIIKKCEESIHLAMLSLWQLQASLTDLSSMPSTTSFATCRRVYNRIQHIIFSDPLIENSADVAARRDKLAERIMPAMAGIGIMAASWVMPSLAGFAGRVAIEEGKRKEHGAQSMATVGDRASYDDNDSDADNDGKGKSLDRSPSIDHASPTGASRTSPRKKVLRSSSAASTTPGLPSVPSFKSSRSSRKTPQTPSYVPGAPIPLIKDVFVHSPRTPVSAKRRQLFPPDARQYGQSQSMTSLPTPTAATFDVPEREISSSKNTGLYDKQSPTVTFTPAPISPTTPGPKSPSSPPASASTIQRTSTPDPHLHKRVPSSKTQFHPYASTSNLPAASSKSNLSADIPPESMKAMLRSYACRSQLDLLTSLQDISTRLIVVPKMARLSSLRAELTVLNHGLPRGCCLCMGCSGKGSNVKNVPPPGSRPSSTSIFASSSTQDQYAPHHRIVRISPSESVVLNSADRAPFLIHVEVLEGDLDFDPTRRQNAEDIRAVMNEREGTYRSRREANTPSRASVSPSSTALNTPRTTSQDGGMLSARPTLSRSPSQRSASFKDLPSPTAANGVSEVDGGDDSIRANESFSSDAAEDEEIDLVEQLYGSFSVHDGANLVTPEYHPEIHNRAVDEEAWRKAGARRSGSFSAKSRPGAATVTSSTQHTARRALTIDEYAERMRMAAIMLSQLNASQQLPMSATDAVTGVVGGGVGIGVNLTYGVGSVVGSVVGVGLDAVRASFGHRRESISAATIAETAGQVGQGASGVTASIDPTSAASGLSALAGSSTSPTFTDQAVPPRQQSGLAHTSPTAQLNPQHVRQRVLAPQEAKAIRERIMAEMMALEEERMARMRASSLGERNGRWSSNGQQDNQTQEEESVILRAINKEDPSGAVFQESWPEKKSRIRKASPYGHLLNWDVFSVIVKTGADLRQEQLAVQLIKEFGRIWTETKCPHWVRYFRILVTSESTGLIETITDAVSVHSIKKDAYAKLAAENPNNAGYLPSYTLYDYFLQTYGEPSTRSYRKAQDAFLRSLASYSIISYLLQIKDRHNGNILVDKQGHVIHIDFGFLLSNSPGSLGFEKAPFKLTQDYIDILGGMGSSKFDEFRSLLKRLFKDIRQHAERLITMVELMQTGSKLPCFSSGPATSQNLRDRFQLGLSAQQADDFVDRLVISSAGSAYTRLYDTFQRHSQGVL